MKLLWAFVLQGTILAANGETHKLTYMYTGLSKPINLPGIHEFTAMGMLDDRIIDYYDSVDQRKIPKVDWMKENLPADYWEKGTQSRQSKQQWFKVNIEILMERMRQNNTDLHVLQGMHGCEGETQPDGSLKFVSGMDKYNYDGTDFLSFDVVHDVWVAHTVAAEPTKRKWDNVQVLKEYTRGYLEYECIDWLSKFLEYGNEQLKQAEPPTVHLFAKKSNNETNIVLTCLATGFIPKETEMKIKQGNEVLTRADGVESTGPLPNGDDTFQRRDYIEVYKDDIANYTCEVSHTVSNFSVTSTWGGYNTSAGDSAGEPNATSEGLAERHKLTYIYTALSKPINLPGIHEFTAMGMLDDRIIDYYDSVIQKKVPKVDWMKENLPADYWEKGTQSRQSKQQWFKVNIELLMDRMQQNDTDLHVLQWMHGCEGETQPDGSLKFVSGMDKYNYDGTPFLSFDVAHEVWVAHTVAAEPTKRKWDNVRILGEYTRGYLEKECIDWLSKFLEYGKEQLKQAKQPTVQLFAKKSNIETNIVLTCLATGFIPKETEMKIKRRNEVLTRADGVETTGPLPNGDDTFQRRDYIEVPKDDIANYTCEVSHRASSFSVTGTWGLILRDMAEPLSGEGSGFPIGPVVVGGLVVLAVVMLVLVLRKRRRHSASYVSSGYTLTAR